MPTATSKTFNAEACVAELLQHLGVPLNEHTKDTPKRYVKMLRELMQGYNEIDFNFTTFKRGDNDQMVVVAGIPFASLCAHHMVPFRGVAHIGYVPVDKIVGLSKMPRVVRHFSQRLQVQEELTAQIANFLEQQLHPLGVGVVMEAEHLCVALRGVKERGCATKTSALRGVFLEKPAVRSEFQWLIGENARHAHQV